MTVFIEFAADGVIVGHNVGYDISILCSELRRKNLAKTKFAAVYDTLDIFRRFYPNLPNHKLSFLSNYFAVEDKPTHNALDDVMATAALLLYAIKNNLVPTQQKRKEYTSSHLDQFRYIAVQINELSDNSAFCRPHELIAKIMNVTRIKEFYEKSPERIERIREFYLIAKYKDNPAEEPSAALNDLLKLTALSNNEMDRLLEADKRIPILTVHHAKGSEFSHVFLAGMQEGIFPAYLALKEGRIEEEKRLFYVAITRAKKRLYLSWSCTSEHGKKNTVSRFLASLPEAYTKKED